MEFKKTFMLLTLMLFSCFSVFGAVTHGLGFTGFSQSAIIEVFNDDDKASEIAPDILIENDSVAYTFNLVTEPIYIVFQNNIDNYSEITLSFRDDVGDSFSDWSVWWNDISESNHYVMIEPSVVDDFTQLEIYVEEGQISYEIVSSNDSLREDPLIPIIRSAFDLVVTFFDIIIGFVKIMFYLFIGFVTLYVLYMIWYFFEFVYKKIIEFTNKKKRRN